MNTLLSRLMNGVAFPQPLYEGEGGGGGGDVKPDPGAGGGDQAAGDAGKAEDGSFLANIDKAADPGPGPAQFPDNWRDLMAGEDKEVRKALDRFKAPGDVAKSWREASTAISKGIKAPERPADDQPDALKAWRAQMGIPEEPTGYQLAEPVAKRFTDAEKPQIELFTTGMHKRDMAPGAVNAALDVYADMQEQIIGQMKARDSQDNQSCQDDLRQEWGKDFKINSTAARTYAEKMTPGINWFEARLPDGSLLGSKPEIVKMFATLAQQEFGDAAFVGGEAAKQSTNRMAEIKAMMADPESDWHKPATRQALFDEYSELIEKQERAQAARTRSGAAPDR